MSVLRHLPFVCIALALVSGGCGRPREAPRHVVLISIDTLRPDHLGCYGHRRPTSPNLDRLAAEGVLFENAFATSPWTLPSHASLLTGLYPTRHGARTREVELAADVPTLAELLSREGFATGGFVNSIFLSSAYGVSRGFETYKLFPEDQSAQGAARRVSTAAARWLASRRDRRVFLFVHYFDVHSDYKSLPRYEKLFRPDTSADGSTRNILRIVVEGDARPEEIERLRRLYDAGIRQMDDELAQLFAWLREKGFWEDSLVIVTSDHGEQFWEHGSLLHTRTHYDEVLRVPLIVRGPSLPAGRRVAAPVSAVDVVPTILGLLDLPTPEGMDGVDLGPLLRADPGEIPARTLFARGGPRLQLDGMRSVRRGRHKLIVEEASGDRELYDLADDPGETRDLANERPELSAPLLEAFEELDGAARIGRSLPEPSADVQERLRALGYQ